MSLTAVPDKMFKGNASNFKFVILQSAMSMPGVSFFRPPQSPAAITPLNYEPGLAVVDDDAIHNTYIQRHDGPALDVEGAFSPSAPRSGRSTEKWHGQPGRFADVDIRLVFLGIKHHGVGAFLPPLDHTLTVRAGICFSITTGSRMSRVALVKARL